MTANIGFFQDFKGSDALLIGVAHDSLSDLIDALEPLSRSGRGPVRVHTLPFITARGVSLVAESAATDQGLKKSDGDSFVWARSPEGWAHVLDQMRALEGTNCGHQYLDGPTDECVVILSIGEYPEHFWHARG